jgi:hypothetical protein
LIFAAAKLAESLPLTHEPDESASFEGLFARVIGAAALRSRLAVVLGMISEDCDPLLPN